MKSRIKQWEKNGWIDDALKQHGMKRVKLHCEGNDITPEQEVELMDLWLEDFQKLLDDKIY